MRTIKIYWVCAGLLVCASCSKSFLQKTPESNLTTGNYFTTATDAENGLTGVYNSLVNGNFYYYDNFMNEDGRSDNCYVNGDNVTAEQPIENFTLTSSNTNVQRDWQELYNDVQAANTVLEAVPGINDPTWSGTTRKQQIIGEASFLRANAYYWLVTEWGDVPLILTATGDYYPAKAKAADVYAQIVIDLKYADSVLGPTPYGNQLGRATKGAADALLAKTYAQMGDYADCLTYCMDVINSGVYSMVPNYANLWGAANKNTTESILEIQFNGSGNPYGNWGGELFDYVASDNWPKRDIASADLVNAFTAAGDSGPRYLATMNWNVANASFNMPENAWDPSNPIPFMNKYPDADGYNSPDDIVLLRLSDIILLAAEANNQLGNTAPATLELNQIRNRAGLANTTASGQTQLATAILNERRLELVHECTRWNDLIRADANGVISLVTLMNSQVDSHGNNLNYNMATDKHQFFWPIPEQDLLLNSNLTQTPGWQ